MSEQAMGNEQARQGFAPEGGTELRAITANTATFELTQAELLAANVELFGAASVIPVQNRMRYLIANDYDWTVHDILDYIEVDELAAKLGTDEDTIHAIITDLAVDPAMIPIDEFYNIVLVPGLDVVIADEFEWRKKYDACRDEITLEGVANVIGAGRKTVENILKASGIQPRETHNKVGTTRYYPKLLLSRVRAEVMMFPYAGDNVTLNQAVGAVGCGRTWAVDYAIENNHVSDLMRTKHGRVAEYYSPEFQELLQLEHTKPNGLFTMNYIAHALGRTLPWIRPRIVRYRQQRHTFIVGNRERTYYDESVFRALEKQSNEQYEVPVISEGEVTLDELIQPLNTTHVTAGRILQQMDIQSFERRSALSGKIIGAYDVNIRIRLAQAIVEERERQLAHCQTLIAELPDLPWNTMTRDEKNRFHTAHTQAGIMKILLQRAREAYERLSQAT